MQSKLLSIVNIANLIMKDNSENYFLRSVINYLNEKQLQ